MRKLLLALLLCSPAWGQYNFHETFEGSGEGCALAETWVDAPTTISTDSGITGSCNLLSPNASVGAVAKDSLALDSACAEWKYRFATSPSDNQQIWRGRNSSDTTRVNVNHDGANTRITMGISGGTSRVVGSVSTNTTYTIEACFQKGTGSNAKFKVRLNGGSFVESTDGTWTDQIENWLIEGHSTTANERFDDIRICHGAYVGGSECEPPATLISDAAVVEGFYPDLFDIQAQSLPDGEPNEVYPGAQFVALNGHPPHTWAVSSGALPEGLSLSSGGALTGTPAAGEGGTHNFTVETTDADGGLAHRDFSIVVESDADPVQQLWERDFTTLRTHYISPTGTGNGSIGSPESFAAARGHCEAGDLHIFRAGTYGGDFETACNGTSSLPIIWKGFIDANGDPENAHIDGTWWFTGAWQWVWSLHCGDPNYSGSNRECLSARAPGISVINSVCQHHAQRSCIGGWNFGPGQVYYGNILHDTTKILGQVSPHNIYTQNVFSQNGWKYFVRNITTDTFSLSSNQLVNIGWGPGTGRRGSGFHIEDNAMVQGRLYHGQHTGFTAGDPPLETIIHKNNWYVGMNSHVRWHIGDQVPVQGIFTNNTWIDSYVWIDEYWGAGTHANCAPYTGIFQFENNRIYNPAGGGTGVYLELRTRNYVSNCSRSVEGGPKIRDADIWDNNTYGRSSGAGTFILGCNGTTSTGNSLASWRTKTDACRETAGGTAFDANSSEGGVPSADEVECFDNFYQPNWGWCRAMNWDGNSSITLPASEVQKIVGNGKTYKVRNSRNFYGTPLETGTYTTGAGIVVSPLPTDTINGVFTFYITSQP